MNLTQILLFASMPAIVYNPLPSMLNRTSQVTASEFRSFSKRIEPILIEDIIRARQEPDLCEYIRLPGASPSPSVRNGVS